MDTTTSPVVVGIADHQPTALRFAARQARATRSPLWIVHSTGLMPQAAEFYAGFEVLKEVRATGQAVLDRAKQFVDEEAPGLEVETVLSEAEPSEAIEHAASDARMVVLGSDDVPWFDRVLRTRVAGRLALRLPCPVVVVPELAHLAVYDGDIVLALDGDTSADGPVRFAFEQAGARDAVLHVLHATPPGTVQGDVDEARDTITHTLAGWQDKFPDVMVMTAFTVADPRDAVTRATESAGLVMMGRPHGHQRPLAVSRPLASAVLREAHCPLAVVPATYGGAR